VLYDLYASQIKEDEMDKAYYTYGGEEKGI
jgi:hypothetical protein